MRESFDRQIADSFKTNLHDIKASEDLIKRTLARVNTEATVNADTNSTQLSAINMGYIRQYEDRKRRGTARKDRIILATLAAVAAIVITANVLLNLSINANPNTATPTYTEVDAMALYVEPTIIDNTAETPTIDYSEFITVVAVRTPRDHSSRAYNGDLAQTQRNRKNPRFSRNRIF